MASEAPTNAGLVLPMEVLVLVLQHVEQQQRLGACALVSHTWRTAANSATTGIALAATSLWSHDQPRDQPRVTGMTDWIPKRSSQLARLNVKGPYDGYLDLALPCLHLTQLEELSLARVKVTTHAEPGTNSSGAEVADEASSGIVAAADSSSGQLLPLVRLSSLLLENCHMQLQDWHGLAALTNLRQLQLHDVSCSPDILREDEDESVYYEQLYSTIGGALSHLVQLTQLHISDAYGSKPVALAHVSRLQHLRDLNLRFYRTQVSLPPLPSSLTCLELRCAAMLTPGTLSGCVQLRHLLLKYCFNQTGSDGGTALLAAMAKMTQLQHLVLLDSMPLASAAAYAALTASSQLTRLSVRDQGGVALPVGAGKHMFAAERQLPCLQAVQLEFGVPEAADAPAADAAAADAAAAQQEMCQQDIDSMFRVCSGLRELDLYCGGSTTWAHLAPLQLHGLLASKSSLTSLTLRMSHYSLLRVGDEEVQHVLSQLTGLQVLKSINDRALGLTHAGLLHLTELRQLRQLSLSLRLRCAVHTPPWATDARCVSLCLESKAPTGSPPDVWQQVQELCERQRLVFAAAARLTAATQAQLVAARAEVAAARAEGGTHAPLPQAA